MARGREDHETKGRLDEVDLLEPPGDGKERRGGGPPEKIAAGFGMLSW